MSIKARPLVTTRKELNPPKGRDWFTEPQEYGELPTFSLGEVSSVFFARSYTWMWKKIHNKDHVHPDYPLSLPRTDGNHRAFQLHHVEVISHAFLLRGMISVNQFENSIVIIKAIARNYGLMKGNEWQRRRRS